jgi:hypothetical protein
VEQYIHRGVEQSPPASFLRAKLLSGRLQNQVLADGQIRSPVVTSRYKDRAGTFIYSPVQAFGQFIFLEDSPITSIIRDC